MKPGIHVIPADVYHADPCLAPSLSNSIAKIMLRQSPRHAWMAHPRLNPHHAGKDSSRFDIGTAAHAVFLERDNSKIVVIDAEDWRSKAAKDARDAARALGKTPLLAAQYDDVSAMVEAASEFLAGSELAGIMSNGRPERTVIWQEPCGIWCRARLDWLTYDDATILDYKTTDSAEPDAFIRRLNSLDYDLQAAFYRRGMLAVTGQSPRFVLLAQEIDAPYSCSLVAMSEHAMTIADEKVEMAIAMWRDCLAADSWPAYSGRIHYAEPPVWAQYQHEERKAREREKPVDGIAAINQWAALNGPQILEVLQ